MLNKASDINFSDIIVTLCKLFSEKRALVKIRLKYLNILKNEDDFTAYKSGVNEEYEREYGAEYSYQIFSSV